MDIKDVPFTVVDWSTVPVEEHQGERGVARWRVFKAGNIRVRMVEYSPGYMADHWCQKGHVLLVLEGQMTTELAGGRRIDMRAGTSYQVADGAEPHRSTTETGARLFIVD